MVKISLRWSLKRNPGFLLSEYAMCWIERSARLFPYIIFVYVVIGPRGILPQSGADRPSRGSYLAFVFFEFLGHPLQCGLFAHLPVGSSASCSVFERRIR